MSWLFVDALSICISALVSNIKGANVHASSRQGGILYFPFFRKPAQYLFLELESIQTQFLSKGSGQSIHWLVKYELPRYSEYPESNDAQEYENYVEKLLPKGKRWKVWLSCMLLSLQQPPSVCCSQTRLPNGKSAIPERRLNYNSSLLKEGPSNLTLPRCFQNAFPNCRGPLQGLHTVVPYSVP